jgi:histone deacetylase HOS3
MTEVQPLNSSRSTRTVVYLQDACLQHRYIRSRDTSAAVELPGRLRAVKLGIAAAISRLESLNMPPQPALAQDISGEDDIAAALGRMNLASELPTIRCRELLVPVIHSSASVAISDHPAVQFVHDDDYIERLAGWARDSYDKIAKGVPEIPDHLSQTDLYRKLYSRGL